VWSWAVTVWEIWTGKIPFAEKSNAAVKDMILTGKFILPRPETPEGFPWSDLYDLMKSCLVTNPKDRPKLEDIKMQLIKMGERDTKTGSHYE
jgi:hypothetical protein